MGTTIRTNTETTIIEIFVRACACCVGSFPSNKLSGSVVSSRLLRMLCGKQATRLCLGLISVVIVCKICLIYYTNSLLRIVEGESNSSSPTANRIERRFAVFGCSTPEQDSHRGFDYVFYLPLTVLAWQRIGFESIVLIIGEKSEWRVHPILSYVLDHLERQPDATVIFISAKVENRMMLSQTARIFVANMKEFPGIANDHIITTDSDLWPLRKEHYYLPPGIDRPLILVHSQCCEPFTFNGKSYPMLPMSHIRASAATWKEIVNINSSFANDSASILNYFQQFFGERVHNRVIFASEDWYLDQKLVSIRVAQWISQNSQDYVYKVSDEGLKRIDRINWNADKIQPSSFGNYFDTHLLVDGFMPDKWESIKPLLNLMYNKSPFRSEWCNRYASRFYKLFIKWKSNSNSS